jgi:hypothetical protein
MNTMIILLDEQEFTPLGKIPTQQTRSDSLTMEERSKILEGGVLENVDNNTLDSIEEAFGDHLDVLSNKKNAFAVFFSKYVRTRALRKDMMRMITKTVISLVEDKRIPKDLRIYIDGMSYSTYYAPSSSFFHTEDGQDMSLSSGSNGGTTDERTPMLKRRRSISAVADIPAHSHMDDQHIRLCKLDITQGNGRETVVKPVWFTKEEQDTDIFGGYDGGNRRPYMGESDVKIPYYLWKYADMINNRLEEDTKLDTSSHGRYNYDVNIYVSSWDSDCIPLCLMAMDGIFSCFENIHSEYKNESDSSEEEHPSCKAILRVLLDTKMGGSCWDFLSFRKNSSEGNTSVINSKKKSEYSVHLRRFVEAHEDEFLTEILDVGSMIGQIRNYFDIFYPLAEYPVDTLCLLFMCGGTDYVKSLPGVGFATIRSVFDAGGYFLLYKSIKYSFENKKDTRTVKFEVNEQCLMGFYNLCVRYVLRLGNMGDVYKQLNAMKRSLSEELKNKKEKLDSLVHLGISVGDEDDQGPLVVESIEREINEIEMRKEYLQSFLWRSHHIALKQSSKKINENACKKNIDYLVNYLGDLSGMSDKQHEDWKTVDMVLKKKKLEKITKARKKMLDNFNLAQKLVRSLPDDKSTWSKDQLKKTTALIGKNDLPGKEIIAKLRNDVKDPRPMTNIEVHATTRASVADIRGSDELAVIVRTLVWNLMYWKLAPFVCLRDTESMRSTAVLKKEAGEEKEESVYGFKSVYKMDNTNKRRKRNIEMARDVCDGLSIAIQLK